MMGSLRVTTINVRGLNSDPGKLRRLAGALPIIFGDVIVVTETKLAAADSDPQPFIHTTHPPAKTFSTLHNNYRISYSTGASSSSGGCAVMLVKEATFGSEQQCLNGVAVRASLRGLGFCIIAIYVNPTVPEFCNNVATMDFFYRELESARADGLQVFLAGDFNCVTSAQDRNSLQCDEPPELVVLRGDLLDAWSAAVKTEINGQPFPGDHVGATYQRGASWSRIDRIYSNAAPKLTTVVCVPLMPSLDHRAVVADYATPRTKPQKTRFIPASLASNKAFREKVAEAAKRAATNHLSLLALRRELRRVAVAFTLKTSKILQLEREIVRAVDPAVRVSLIAEVANLRDTRDSRTAISRRVSRVQQEERSTRLFFSRPKSYGGRTFRGLYDNTGQLQVEAESAVTTAFFFYQELYRQPTALDRGAASTFVERANVPQISVAAVEALSAPLSKDDFIRAIRRLRKGRAAGEDGIPAEILKVVGEPLSELCELHWPHYMREGRLPDHLRGSTIVLLEKKGKDPRHIANLRPVALLNSMYKIFATALADRLGPVLSGWAHPFQTGFIPGRRITHNTLELQSIYDYANKKGAPVALALLDIKKAFDSVHHDWLDLVMEKAGFPVYFRRAVRTITAEGIARVRIGNYFSEPLRIERGVRQGCPLSPLLFAIAMDPVLRQLNALVDPSSITLPGDPRDGRFRPWCPEVVSGARMYADDTGLIAFSAADLRTLVAIVRESSAHTGLYINEDKSTVVALGEAAFGSEWRRCLPSAEWADSATYLGLRIGRREALSATWQQAADRADTLALRWAGAGYVGLRGRAVLHNAYVGPHVLLLANIHPIDEASEVRMHSKLRDFMWPDTGFLMRPSLLSHRLGEGGLGIQLPRSIVYARRMQQLRELPSAFLAGWAWASLLSLELTCMAPRSQAMAVPTTLIRFGPPGAPAPAGPSADGSTAGIGAATDPAAPSEASGVANSQMGAIASECLKALRFVKASLACVPAQHLALAPYWLTKMRSRRAESLIWSLKPSNPTFIQNAEAALGTSFGDLARLPPTLGQRLARWNQSEWGYDRLLVVGVTSVSPGHLYRIDARRLLGDHSLEADTTYLMKGSSFGRLVNSTPDELLLLSPETHTRVTIASVLLSKASSRDYKSAYRIAVGEPVLPYHRIGITPQDMYNALACAWKFCDPAVAAFVWKVYTGRVRPLERLARYSSPSSTTRDLNGGICTVCNLDQETMQHILLDCPHSQVVRDRARELFSSSYIFDTSIHNLYPVVGGALVDRLWAVWAFSTWFVLWKARSKAEIERTAYPAEFALNALEVAWQTFGALRAIEMRRDAERKSQGPARSARRPHLISEQRELRAALCGPSRPQSNRRAPLR